MENEALQTENKSLQIRIFELERNTKKLGDKKKINLGNNGKKKFVKWIKYYNSTKSEAVDFNCNNIDTNKNIQYIMLISEAKELLKKIFECFSNDPNNRIDSISKFKAIMFNPKWYQDKEYRKELVDKLGILKITNNEFINSELVRHYFN